MSKYMSVDNVYFNVVINQNNSNEATNLINNFPAEYNINRTIPIVTRASDYYLSIIRFTVPLNTVPLYIFPIQPMQPNPNLSTVLIGITYNGVNYPQYVIFQPTEEFNEPPVQNMPTQVITPYYYCYSYQQMLCGINSALLAAITASGLSLGAGTQPPYFYIDYVTGLINFVIPSLFTNPDPVNGPFIYINDLMSFWLDAFWYDFIGVNQPYGRDFVFRLTINETVTVGPPITPNTRLYSSITQNDAYAPFGVLPTSPPSYYKLVQEYSILATNWNSLKKIIISTNTLPIVNEQISTGNANQTAASFPILTDFVPNFQAAGEQRSAAYYFPTSQYRLVDLVSDQPITNINIKLYWQDAQQNIYTIYINNLQQIEIKFAFVRKTLYNSAQNLLKM